GDVRIEHELVGDDAGGHRHDRVVVALLTGDVRLTDGAAASLAVHHVDGLGEDPLALENRCDGPGHVVRAAAWGVWDDKLDGLVGVVVRNATGLSGGRAACRQRYRRYQGYGNQQPPAAPARFTITLHLRIPQSVSHR